MTPREVHEVAEAHQDRRDRRDKDRRAAAVYGAWYGVFFTRQEKLSDDHLKDAIHDTYGVPRPMPTAEDIFDKFDSLTAGMANVRRVDG